ncbi:hypothetical protein DFH27DRAFT_650744 [Peziza echinospora]|nr:hypothetical protein DFH27DRAFT_650744 [Peziza echinospora]
MAEPSLEASSKKRANANKIIADFVLAREKSITPEKVCGVLLEHPEAIGFLLQSEEEHAFFISEISGSVQRIVKVLDKISEELGKKKCLERDGYATIIHHMITDLVIPLLDLKETHDAEGVVELVVTAMDLAYGTHHLQLQRRGAQYRDVLCKISDSKMLMTALLLSTLGAAFLRKVFVEHSVTKEAIFGSNISESLLRWTEASADLCQSCPSAGQHAIPTVIDNFRALKRLRSVLNRQLDKALKDRAAQPSVPLRSFEQMTKLIMIDKEELTYKPGRASQPDSAKASPKEPVKSQTKGEFDLSPEDQQTLRTFTKREPQSIPTVQAILVELNSGPVFRVFKSLILTFPCATCLLKGKDEEGFGIREQIPHHLRGQTHAGFTDTLLGEKLGIWRVCLSEQALQDLASQRNEGVNEVIRRLLEEIASGDWSSRLLDKPLSAKNLRAAGAEKVPLWRASCGPKKASILWQVNVGYDEGYESQCQIVTVWRICDEDEIANTVKSIFQLQEKYSTLEIEQRTVSMKNPGRVQPHKFKNAGTDIGVPKGKSLAVGGKLSDSDIAAQEALMNNKFYCVTEKVLNQILSVDSLGDMEFPFDISEEETEIIRHANNSAFILGRSGTGKTTCLLYKLLCRYIAGKEQFYPIRQIFLTRSSYLAGRLGVYLGRLVNAQLKEAEKIRILPSTDRNTFRESEDPLENVTLDYMENKLFPLVCTDYYRKKKTTQIGTDTAAEHTSSLSNLPLGSRIVNFKVFNIYYWPYFSQHLTRGLEVDQVFADILGVIKGSSQISTNFSPLSEEEYCSLSARVAPVFTTPEDRSRVYKVYIKYEAMKERLGDRDSIDRVIALLLALNADEELKKRVQKLFDEVYVDELQDQKLLEIDLLLTLVRNPHGIHFAGDTAQCISRDSTFRFEDVKARFFHHFLAVAESTSQPSLARPELYKLAKNYRSHQGILSLAAEVINMLCNVFPGQIDRLAPEFGSYDGALPIIFAGYDSVKLLSGGAGIEGAENGISYFGADQVILVRDDDAKRELKARLKSSAQVLTILDSKGLEFEDVILYQFFGSPSWSKLRLSDYTAFSRSSNDSIDSSRFAPMCSELKHLYVAVTRARKNLWIIENDKASVDALSTVWINYRWVKEPLVEVFKMDDDMDMKKAKEIIKPGKSTKPDAWVKQGNVYLAHAMYEEAWDCFDRGSDEKGRKIATAYIQFDMAMDRLSDLNEKVRKTKFTSAANSFEEEGHYRMASQCWIEAGEILKAAEILSANGDHGKAAPLFKEVAKYRKAAECYHLAGMHDDAAMAYRAGEHLTELFEYVKGNKGMITKNLQKRYEDLLNLIVKRAQIEPNSQFKEISAGESILGDVKAQESFYHRFGYTTDLRELKEKTGDLGTAFSLAIRDGKHWEALKISLKPNAAHLISKGDVSSLFNILQAGCLWKHLEIDFRRGPPFVANLQRKYCEFHNDPNTFGKPTKLRGPRHGWDHISKIIVDSAGVLCLSRESEVKSAEVSEFIQSSGGGFLDLYELLNLTNPERISGVRDEASQLPIQTLSRFTTMVAELNQGKRIATNLLNFLGILLLPAESQSEDSKQEIEAQVLPWSPIHSEKSRGVENESKGFALMDAKSAEKQALEWLRGIVAGVGNIVFAKSFEIRQALKKQSQQPQMGRKEQICDRSCQHDYNPTRCDRSHKLPTPEHLRKSIDDLTQVAGIWCNFTHLYYHRALNLTTSIEFQGHKRSFLEKLLEKLTFISPFVHDEQVQEDAWLSILTLKSQLTIASSIRDLFFFRLRDFDHKKERVTLSALLEERDLAGRLDVLDSFFRRIKFSRIPKGHWDCLLECNNLAVGSFAAPHEVFLKSTRLIIHYHKAQHTDQLRTFHATLSLFECLAVSLLFRITENRDLLIPTSIRNKIDISSIPVGSVLEKDDLMDCLMDTLICLSHMLYNLGHEAHLSSNVGFQDPGAAAYMFIHCGKSSRVFLTNLVVRRALDFLCLCLVNVGAGINPNFRHRRFFELKNMVDKVSGWAFRLPSSSLTAPASGQRFSTTDQEIAPQLHELQRRHQRSGLAIIESTTTLYPYRRTLLQNFKNAWVPVLSRAAISRHGVDRSTIAAGNSAFPNNLQDPKAMDSGYNIEQVERAVGTIHKFWKKWSVLLRLKRAYAKVHAKEMATAEGHAKYIIKEYMQRNSGQLDNDRKRVLRTEGIPMLTDILHLKSNVEKLNTCAKRRLASDKAITVQFIGQVQDILSFADTLGKHIEETLQVFTQDVSVAGGGEKRLVDLQVDKLQNKLSLARRQASKHQGKVLELQTQLQDE